MRSASASASTDRGVAKRPAAHVCSVCNKRFTKRSNLRIHERLHTGERPYVCRYHGCGRSYKWLSSINFHEGRCERRGYGLASQQPLPSSPVTPVRAFSSELVLPPATHLKRIAEAPTCEAVNSRRRHAPMPLPPPMPATHPHPMRGDPQVPPALAPAPLSHHHNQSHHGGGHSSVLPLMQMGRPLPLPHFSQNPYAPTSTNTSTSAVNGTTAPPLHLPLSHPPAHAHVLPPASAHHPHPLGMPAQSLPMPMAAPAHHGGVQAHAHAQMQRLMNGVAHPGPLLPHLHGGGALAPKVEEDYATVSGASAAPSGVSAVSNPTQAQLQHYHATTHGSQGTIGNGAANGHGGQVGAGAAGGGGERDEQRAQCTVAGGVLDDLTQGGFSYSEEHSQVLELPLF